MHLRVLYDRSVWVPNEAHLFRGLMMLQEGVARHRVFVPPDQQHPLRFKKVARRVVPFSNCKDGLRTSSALWRLGRNRR